MPAGITFLQQADSTKQKGDGGKCARKHRCLRMITDSVVIRGHLSLSPNG